MTRRHTGPPGPLYLLRDPDELDLEALLAGHITARRVDHPTRAAAVRHLTERGLSAAETAARLGMSERTVQRYRARTGVIRSREERARSCVHDPSELSTYDDGRQRCRACRRDAWHLRETSR
ncbi:hypothetical protein GCM10023403_10430 [Pseudonocardia benzenivorans]